MTPALPAHSPSIVARDLINALGRGGNEYRVIATSGGPDDAVTATLECTLADGTCMTYNVAISAAPI
ncbi:hypothetical protein [uncultured Jatrophihabitans sp.]|uniref:hypothetical protein n=1 Tax=uncultured Jatrophihabitans sp. TaxID=1610747 RepID=UPI0035CBAD71